MNWARLRIAGAGEFEKEWNRLVGFKTARVSMGDPLAVWAARWVTDAGEDLGPQQDWLCRCLGCSEELPRDRPLRCEPKLRMKDGEIGLLRAVARLCRRA